MLLLSNAEVFGQQVVGLAGNVAFETTDDFSLTEAFFGASFDVVQGVSRPADGSLTGQPLKVPAAHSGQTGRENATIQHPCRSRAWSGCFDRPEHDQSGDIRQTVTVIELPEIKYARIGDADVAYAVFGGGSRDLLICSGLGAHVDLIWQISKAAEFLQKLAKFRRVIFMDRRGSGASDPVPLMAVPTWEEMAEDIMAVLDVTGSDVADLLALNEVGPIAILVAAMHPERVGSLVLINTAARYAAAADYPIGVESDVIRAIGDVMASTWGSEDFAAVTDPDQANDPEFVKTLARMHRAAATPHTASAQFKYLLESMDVRQFLPLVQAPSLVLQATESAFTYLEHARFLADHLPAATLVEMPGGNMTMPFAPNAISEITEFLTGERPPIEVDRVLTTILFTDIVGSTERAAQEGDRRWGQILEAHHQAVRAELRRYRGVEIDTAGDGFFATFDGPARAIRCACAVRDSVRSAGVEIRVGLHTGEVQIFGDTYSGLGVHIGARVGAQAGAGEVLVSRTVVDLVVGSGIAFTERGEHELKGVPGRWKLFSVVG
jgi:class 3 adenylate cyclase